MRIAHLADLHLTTKNDDSGETLTEQVKRIKWIVEDAAEEKVELFLVAGDTFHARSNAEERNAATSIYLSMAEVAPVVIVKGNNIHDGFGEIDYLQYLRTRYLVRVAERPTKITLPYAIILCMPYPEKAWLASQVDAGQSIDEVAAKAMRQILLGFAVETEESKLPVILLGHLELGAALTDDGQPMIGKCCVELSESDLLETGADYIALGHIHKYQILGGSGRICYAGSPRQTRHGEDNMKGYCLVDVERHGALLIEHRRTPGPELVTVRARMDGGLLREVEFSTPLVEDGIPTGEENRPLIVRLVYAVDESERRAAAEQAEKWKRMLMDSGIRSVKIDARTQATTRVRSEAITKARTNRERLDAYWGETEDKEPYRAKQIMAKLDEIDAEII